MRSNYFGTARLEVAKALIFGAAVVAALLLALLAAKPARADTFAVNSTGDTGDATPDGTCDSDPGAAVVCTLREAI